MSAAAAASTPFRGGGSAPRRVRRLAEVNRPICARPPSSFKSARPPRWRRVAERWSMCWLSANRLAWLLFMRLICRAGEENSAERSASVDGLQRRSRLLTGCVSAIKKRKKKEKVPPLLRRKAVKSCRLLPPRWTTHGAGCACVRCFGKPVSTRVTLIESSSPRRPVSPVMCLKRR